MYLIIDMPIFKAILVYRHRIACIVVMSFALLISCKKESQQDAMATSVTAKPNVLFILTDDQAYGDLSLMGNPISETPNLDLLAQNGAFFDHFYVSPVCAPTRASLLTGRYHQRTGVTGVTRGRENMNLDEETLAEILKRMNKEGWSKCMS